MPFHDTPFEPLTREAVRLTRPGDKLLMRKRSKPWNARRFGGFVSGLPEREQFRKWAKLKRKGVAPANAAFERLWNKFLNMT